MKQKTDAVADVTVKINELEAGAVELKNSLKGLNRSVRKAYSAVNPTLADKACMNSHLRAANRAAQALEDAFKGFHEVAEAVARGEDIPIASFGPGGSKPPPCDDDIEDCP